MRKNATHHRTRSRNEFLLLHRGKQGQRGCCPFPLHPKSPPNLLRSLRTISLDDSEHLLHKSPCQRRFAPTAVRLRSGMAVRLPLRNRCSPHRIPNSLTHLHSQLSPTLRRTFQFAPMLMVIDPRNRTDFGSTNRYCEDPVSAARQKLKELCGTLRPQYRRLPSRLLEFASSTS